MTAGLPVGSLLQGLRGIGGALQRIPRPLGIVLAVIWMLLIWNLSSRAGEDAPAHFWKSWLWNTGHAPLFGVLAVWPIIALPRVQGWPRLSRSAVILIALFVLGYAVVDEFHQARTPGRTASAFDVATDCVGASCTLWLARYVGRSEANARGLYARLAAGLALCALFGLMATLES